MIEVIIEVDCRPLSTFGCDGVVMGTPTGSTAYAFSGGGPVVWPEVEAILMVPLSAHALFARPLVAAPTSTLAVELMPENGASGVLWCDGRRTVELDPGSRIEVRRSESPCCWPASTPRPSRSVWCANLSCPSVAGAVRRRLRRSPPSRGGYLQYSLRDGNCHLCRGGREKFETVKRKGMNVRD